MRKNLIILLFLQLTIFTIMFIYHKELSIIPYINVSFIIGGLLFFIGLLIYVVSNGFFDIFTISMRKAFTPKRNLKDVESMRSPSELFDFPYRLFFQQGGFILLCMSIALIIYFM